MIFPWEHSLSNAKSCYRPQCCLLLGVISQCQTDVAQLQRAKDVACRSVAVFRREEFHHQLLVAVETDGSIHIHWLRRPKINGKRKLCDCHSDIKLYWLLYPQQRLVGSVDFIDSGDVATPADSAVSIFLHVPFAVSYTQSTLKKARIKESNHFYRSCRS